MKRLFTLTSFLSLQGRGRLRYEIFFIGDEHFDGVYPEPYGAGLTLE